MEKVEMSQNEVDECPILAALEKLENYVDVRCWRMIQAAKRKHQSGASANDIRMAMEFVRIKESEDA